PSDLANIKRAELGRLFLARCAAGHGVVASVAFGITAMTNPIEIEDIREMRREQGIEDAELQQAIGELRVGDYVQLTLKTSAEAFHGETVIVRVTRLRDVGFLGKLARSPASAALARLRAGARVAFTAAHIHSVPKGPGS